MYFMHLPHLTAGMHVIFEFFCIEDIEGASGTSLVARQIRGLRGGEAIGGSQRHGGFASQGGGDKLQQLTAFVFLGGGGVGKIKAKMVAIRTYVVKHFILEFEMWEMDSLWKTSRPRLL